MKQIMVCHQWIYSVQLLQGKLRDPGGPSEAYFVSIFHTLFLKSQFSPKALDTLSMMHDLSAAIFNSEVIQNIFTCSVIN